MTIQADQVDGNLGPESKYFDWGFLAYIPPVRREQAVADLSEPWSALMKTARSRLARVVPPPHGPQYLYSPDHFTLFYNTTGAFQRVLSRVARGFGDSLPTLLTTDLEFPGCVAAIDDAWSGRLVVAQLAERLMAGEGDQDAALADAVIRAANFVKPRVVFLSHVMRTTGQVLSPRVVDYLRAANPRVIIILDGSQAVGNVVVRRELLETVDFYVGCGHKWLGGMTSSGFVWQKNTNRRIWDLSDPAQSTSFPGYLGGTGNAAAWISLTQSLTDLIGRGRAPHTRQQRLALKSRRHAALFLEELGDDRRYFSIVTPLRQGLPPTGMLILRMLETTGAAVIPGLKEAGYVFTTLGDEVVPWSDAPGRFAIGFDRVGPAVTPITGSTTGAHPASTQPEIRFCFRWSHSDADVRALARTVRASLPRSRRRRFRPLANETSLANALGGV